ncbi:MAG: hypothetical protein ACLTG4_09285 [Oscillospiraceae bacterium]
MTKVLTLLLVMEALDTGRIGWDDTVIASEAACAKGGSSLSGAGRGDEHGRNAQIRRRAPQTTAPRRWRSMWQAAKARSSA